MFSLLSVTLMTLDHRQKLADPLRSALSAAVQPIHYVVNFPFEVGDYLSEQLSSRQKLLEENTRLKTQHLLDEARMQRLDQLERENIRLQDLLDSSHEVEESVLIAELMRVDLDPYTHIIEIDKGTSSGVFAGQPVLDAKGVMGHVDQVGRYTSTVRLITDPSDAIPVQVNRNGLRTIALGVGNLHELDLPHLPNNADIRVGDLLVTSGLGGRFPQGYPVARVTQVEIDPSRPFAHITAVPTAELDRSRELLLVRTRREPPATEAGRSAKASPKKGEAAK